MWRTLEGIVIKAIEQELEEVRKERDHYRGKLEDAIEAISEAIGILKRKQGWERGSRVNRARRHLEAHRKTLKAGRPS